MRRLDDIVGRAQDLETILHNAGADELDFSMPKWDERSKEWVDR